jgi:hypothetical protein
MSAVEPAGTDTVDLRERIALVELVDRVLGKGVVLTGDVTLSVAGVDLVYLGLRVLLTSVASLEQGFEREEVAA